MHYRLAVSAVIFFTLVGLSPLQAQDMRLLATGSGTLSADETTYAASYEFWGKNDKAELVKVRVGEDELQISVSRHSEDGKQAEGSLTPCEGGNCPCWLQEDEAGTSMTGSCRNEAYPEHGELRLSIANIEER